MAEQIVMIKLRAIAILALLLSLGGCDGYAVTLNIRERPASDEKAHRHTVYICSGQNAVDLVQAVAKSLNLIEVSASAVVVSQNQYEWHSSDGRFRLALQNPKDGAWPVVLADWPESSRSELSKRVEAEIRQRVRTDCSPR